MIDYQYKTPPFGHQKMILDESADDEWLSLFLKPGTGKTKIIIDNVTYLYEQDKIDALLVIAPNGVHLNWATDEIPLHMPDRVQKNLKAHVWYSTKAKTAKATKAREELLGYKGFVVLLASYEATITEAFKTYMRRFFAKRRVFMALDESHRIKSRGSKCKLTITAMGAHAKYRRILSGTPLEKPPDLYSPLRFLSKDFWPSKGFKTAAEFDATFCVTVERKFGGRPAFKQTVGYKNLDLLAKLVAETGYSLSLEDVGIHLPPILYTKRYHDMFPEQRKIYENLKTQFRHEFDDGLIVDCEAAITRLLRLQQVVCGYLGTGPGEPIRRIDEKKNPRLEMVVEEILEDLPHAAIVWCRFKADIDALMDALGKEASRYDGQVSNEDRHYAKEAFKAGDKKFLIMSTAGAEGLTLTQAKTMVFYSNQYSILKREQMEGRSWRIGQTANINIIDVVCEGTVDNDIIQCMRDKFDIAGQLSGNKLREWL